MSALELPVDQQFAIHATAIAIKELDRDELEEAFIDMLHQNNYDAYIHPYLEAYLVGIATASLAS